MKNEKEHENDQFPNKKRIHYFLEENLMKLSH